MPDPRTAYQRHKERTAARQRSQSRAGRDIAPLPPIADPARRAAGTADLRLWCETYLPQSFPLAWSADHLQAIARFQSAVRFGGLFALAMPRGRGKTTLALACVLWAVLNGYRHYVVLIAATDSKARELLASLKTELETNDLLAADYPEAIHPIRRLERIRQAANGQLFNGQPTDQDWKANRLVLATIPGSPSSGATIAVAGLTGAHIRGNQRKDRSGRTLRPDLAVIDDPQTAASAASRAQCAKRAAIISKDVLGMAGPGAKLAAVAAVTIIEPHDLAARLLDRDQFPEWGGSRYQALDAFPKRMDLWEEYHAIRAAELRDGGDGRKATAFYRKNRAAMQEGARVTWPQRYDSDELDGLQHCMNLFFRDPVAFAAEQQNDPKAPGAVDAGQPLKAEEICRKLNGVPQGRVPPGCHLVTAYIDVHQSLLFWAVVAWEKTSAGHVIDYGAWPEQPRAYFTLSDARRTLQSMMPGPADLDATLTAGFDGLAAHLLARDWTAAGDAPAQRIARSGMDANWGLSTDAVYAWCRRGPWPVFPTHGRSITATGKPMSEWREGPGELAGHHWRIVAGRRQTRHLLIDTNYWKSTILGRLALPRGARGALQLYGTDHRRHQMLADHLTAEYAKRDTSRGRTVDVWFLHPGRDNHLLDCVVNAAVIASTLGVDFSPAVTVAVPAKPTKPSAPSRPSRRRVSSLKA